MSEEFPTSVSLLLSFLEGDRGLSTEQEWASQAFGDRMIVLRGQGLRVRVLRDRLRWFVQVGYERNPNQWFDMALLKEQITGHVGDDEPSFDEQTDILRANWKRIVEMLTGPTASQASAELEQRRLERAKRRYQ